MADVVNSMATSPQGRPNTYATSPCTSNNSLVSPNIVEAIDRIFPKSPSQLLAHPFSENFSSKRTSADAMPHPQSNSVVSSLQCMVSTAHLTTDTTTTATAIFTGLTTSSGTKSPVMSSTPTNHLDLPSLPAQAKVNQPSYKNGTVEMNLKNSDVQKDLPQTKRVSRADLEIMNNLANDQIMKNGRAGRFGMSNKEKEINDNQSKDLSDSDDMCRPFVSLQKERKKKKRKHKSSEQRRESEAISKSSLGSPSSPKISKFSLPATASGYSTENDFCPQYNNSAIFSPLGDDHCSKVNGITNDSVQSEKDDISLCEDVSSSKTPVISPCDVIQTKKSSSSRQKLPKSKRNKYHVSKDSRRIKKFFPPSFVVLNKIDELLLQGIDFGHSIDFNLSSQERVQVLSSLCVQSKIPCSSRQKTIDEIFNYRSPVDDFVCNNSEDEFRIPQGRSLRKRRQDICYVEPTEDDLLEDISVASRKKSSGQPKKETPSKKDVPVENVSPPKTDSEVPKEVSRKKKVKKSKTSEHEPVVISHTPSHSKSNKSTLPLSQPSVENSENLYSSTTTTAAAASTSKSNNVYSTTSSAATSPNLVYVYPKTSIVTGATNTSATVTTPMSDQAGKKTSTTAKSTRPGPASKTNKPPNIVVSKAPVTTLNLLAGSKNSGSVTLPTGFSGIPLPASAFPQYFPTLASNLSTTAPKNNLPSNLCMVKIDGKDYLLSMPGSNNLLAQAGSALNSTSTPAIPLSQPSLVSPAAPRYMLYQPTAGVMAGLRPTVLSQGSATTKSLTPSFTIPRLSTAVTLPGRPSSSTIHLLPTSLTSSSTLSSASLLGSAQASVASANIAIATTKNSVSSTQPNLVTQKPSSVVSSATSAGISSSSQSVSTVITTTSGARQVRSLVTPLIAPGSTTVIRHHPGQTSTTSSSTVQLVAPNPSVTGARCFRIIVPACSTTGSSARIATLGTSALTSPLTRLSASSTLLPQRKHSVDKEMSPEKRAAKRRRLEKKYPLPPGVVIKTEPLDSPQSSSSVQSTPVRSLLSGQNIQLIAASSRSGVGGVQRFRIISPTAPGVVVGSRPVRLGSNVIIRAPLIAPSTSRISSSSTVLTLATTSASTASSLLSTSTTSATASGTALQATLTASSANSAVSVNSSTTSGSRGNISLLSPSTLLFSSTAVLTSSVTSSVCISTTSSSSHDTSCSVSSSTTTVVSSHISSLSIGSIDTTSTSVANGAAALNLSSDNQRNQPPSSSSVPTETSGSSTAAVDIDTMKESIKKLQSLIQAQEARGLKGARLDKLKELLGQKEKLLLQIEQQEEEVNRCDGNEEDPAVSIGVSADDPVIID